MTGAVGAVPEPSERSVCCLPDRPTDVAAQNTRPRFSAPGCGLNLHTRRARARRCKGGSTTARYDRAAPFAFLNNRHYDPTTGVFVSVDPLVTMTGEPYIYGAANPVTYSDPSGLDPGDRAWIFEYEQKVADSRRAVAADPQGFEDFLNHCVTSPVEAGCVSGNEWNEHFLPFAQRVLRGFAGDGNLSVNGYGAAVLSNSNDVFKVTPGGDGALLVSLVAPGVCNDAADCLVPILDFISLTASFVSVGGLIVCPWTAGLGCGVAAGAEVVASSADTAATALVCGQGHQEPSCGLRVGGTALGYLSIGSTNATNAFGDLFNMSGSELWHLNQVGGTITNSATTSVRYSLSSFSVDLPNGWRVHNRVY